MLKTNNMLKTLTIDSKNVKQLIETLKLINFFYKGRLKVIVHFSLTFF